MITQHKRPELNGILGEQAAAFIDYKRAQGYKYSSEEKVLSRLCHFAETWKLSEIALSKAFVEAWIKPRPEEAAKSRAHRISCIRQFGQYLKDLGFEVYHLPPQKENLKKDFTPYIFTHQEITNLLKAVDETSPCEQSRDMHLALPVIFRILYGCGLRVSEVLKLRLQDVKLTDGVLTIRDAKFGKDRYIPMSASVTDACIAYSENILWQRDNDFFFMAPDRTMISPNTIYQRFRRYLEAAGISHGGKNHGPRLHDLRHTFSVHVLQKWIENGNDLMALLPILSTYLGHKSLGATSDYLRLTAEVYPDVIKTVEKTCSTVIPSGD